MLTRETVGFIYRASVLDYLDRRIRDYEDMAGTYGQTPSLIDIYKWLLKERAMVIEGEADGEIERGGLKGPERGTPANSKGSELKETSASNGTAGAGGTA